MVEKIDQYESAINHLFRLLRLSVEDPGVIRDMTELNNWLLMTASERNRQGDFGAGRILERLADRGVKA